MLQIRHNRPNGNFRLDRNDAPPFDAAHVTPNKISLFRFLQSPIVRLGALLSIISGLIPIPTAHAAQFQVATPILSVSVGSSTSNVTVTMTDATDGASLYYTTNGIAPTTNAPSLSSGQSLTIPMGTTLMVQGYLDGSIPSTIIAATYTASGILSASGQSTLALKNDGTFWAWGNNNTGQLGLGAGGGTNVSKPTQVPLSGVGALPIHSLISKSIAYDNGLSIPWEITYFGSTGNDPNALAPSGNGQTILQAYQQGANPNDYFSLGSNNTIIPYLSIVSGNNQALFAGTTSSPLIVQINDVQINPLTNAPVTFAASGTGLIAETAQGTFSQSIQLTSDTNGQIQFFAQMPSTATNFSVTATAGPTNDQTYIVFNVQAEITPDSITGLGLWFKADSGVTQDGSSNVTAWADQTGNYTVIQTNKASEPTYVTNILNSNPVLRFNGSQFLSSLAQVGNGLNTGLTIISIASTTLPISLNWRMTLYLGKGPQATSRGIGYYKGLQVADFYQTTATGVSSPNANTFVTEAITIDSGLGNVTFYRNGLQTATSPVSGIGNIAAGIGIGNVSDGSFSGFWRGDIAEVLVYDHSLSPSEWGVINQYIGNKYGIYAPSVYALGAPWISSYSAPMQLLINQYQLNKDQADQYSSWILSYTPEQQGEILSHQWSQSQADNYVALQSNTTNLPTSGLSMWFKADSGVTKDGTGKVTSWSDQTGNYSVTQSISTNKPTYLTSDVNGLPALHFNGKQFLSNRNRVDNGLNAGLTTITVASTATPNSSNWQFSLYLGGGPNANARGIGYHNGKQDADYFAKGLSSGTAPNANVFVVDATTIDSGLGNVSFYRNGLHLLTDTISGIGNISAGVGIGNISDNSYSYFWKGDIAEVLVYDHQLSQNEWTQVNQYIGDKYQIYTPSATWPLTYTAPVQAEIATHQWTKAQADNFVTFQSTNTNLPTLGLSMWFKADSGVTQDGNSNVTSWSDQTGNYSVIQSNSTNMPTYVTNVLNSNPVVRFNGSQFLSNGITVDNGFNSALTMITVASTAVPSGSNRKLSFYLGKGPNANARGIGYYNGLQESDYYNTRATGAAEPDTNAFVVEATTVDNGIRNEVFYRNGAQTAATTISGIYNIATGIGIGNIFDNSFSGFWQGDIAEVLIYDHQLSANEMAQVNQYIVNKYGVYYMPNATWIGLFSDPMQAIINEYQLSESQAYQYMWITNYPAPIQAEIMKHQWSQTQAANYAAMQLNNTNLPTAGLSLWFKADAGVTQDANNNVLSWADQTGNFMVTNVAENGPLYVTNALNGQPVVRLSAGSSGLANVSSPADPGLSNDITILTVISSTNSGGYAVSLGDGTSSGSRRAVGYQSGAQFMDDAAVSVSGGAIPASGTPTIDGYSLDSTNNNVSFYSNGVLTTNTAITGLARLGQGINIGEVLPSQGMWQGDIAEVLVYDHQLSASEIQQVNTYLGGKYGISVPILSPIITPYGGSATSSLSVSITGETSPEVILYTVDGSVPVNTSPQYTNSLTLTNDTLINAAFFTNGVMAGSIASAQFYIGDSAQIGIPDTWQQQYFGYIGINPNAQTPAGNGLSNLQAYHWGYSPTDFYNGLTPSLAFAGGAGQRGAQGTLLPLPLSVLVNGGQFNAPVNIQVKSGSALITVNGSTPAQSVQIRSTALLPQTGQRVAQVSILLPNISNDVSVIEVTPSGLVTTGTTPTLDTTASTFNTNLQPPTNFTAVPTSSTTALLTWTPSDTNEPTTVEISSDGEINWSFLQTVAPGLNSTTVSNLTPDQTISFRLYTGDNNSN